MAETIFLITHKDKQLDKGLAKGADIFEIAKESNGAPFVYVGGPLGGGASFDLNAKECRQVAYALLAEAERMEAE